MADEPAASEYVTVAEIADMLRVVPQTVYNWVDRGELPAVRAGGRRVRIRRDDLEAFLHQRDTKTSAPPLSMVALKNDLAAQRREIAALRARVELLEHDRDSEPGVMRQ